jgi:transketolase
MTDLEKNQRRCFADELYKYMSSNDKIMVLTADLGYKMWDKIRSDFPERFINVGASEQLMISMSVGLALEGKIPIAFSITSFLLYRPFEIIRNYVNREKIQVKMIASGRNKDYMHDGFSHWAEDDKEILKVLNNIKAYWPDNVEEIPILLKEMISDNNPWYINLRR